MSEQVREHDSLESSVAAYVLGACDPQEAEVTRDHITSCASCRELAGRLGRAADSLPLAVEDVAPPDRLRARILAAAAAAPRHPGTVPPPERRRIIQLPRARMRPAWASSRAAWPQAAVAVLALAVIGLGGWNVALTRQLGQAQAAHFELQGSGPMAGSQANVISFRRDGVTVVDFRNMPQLDPGSVYQVWLIDPSGNAISGGVFRPEPDGSKTLLMTRNVSGFAKMGVTRESGPDGVRAPTAAPQLVGQID